MWVHTQGRSHWEAVTRALDALDLLRGIWNFALNRRKWSRTTGGARRPVDQVLLGPLHSLHDPDGSLVSPADWFESDYVKPAQSRELSRRWKQVKEDEHNVRAGLARSAYQEPLEDALRRYTRALDLFQWEAAFLGLWGLLETLTGTKPHDGHDLTMRRASFLYPDPEREVHFQTLNHLRHYRNRSVHGGESSTTIEAYLYQLKRYVEQLLFFHLTNTYRFGSVERASEFLGLPPGPDDLRRMAKAHRKDSKDARAAAELADLGERFRLGL